MDIEPSRKGKVTEYKRGHNYMTVIEWDDGHCEIEVHECIPKLVFHSCDFKELENARNLFKGLPQVTYPNPEIPQLKGDSNAKSYKSGT